MKLNLTKEFIEFLEFVGIVATSIRMNSAYTERHDPHDVMWLSESLHDFTQLTKALIAEDFQEIARTAALLIGTYTWYKNGGGSCKSDPKDSFQKYPWIDLDKGIAIFQSIKDKADHEIQTQGDRQ